MRRSLVTALALGFAGMLGASAALAQVSTSAVPVYHGQLIVRKAKGTIRKTGDANMQILDWTFKPYRNSNGIYPDQEPIVVAIQDESFRLEAGSLKPSKGGTLFKYKARGRARRARGIIGARFERLADGSYDVSLTLHNIDLSILNRQTPTDCMPMAILVGDDDGFSGVVFDRPLGFRSRTIDVLEPCDTGTDWPWIR
jgi:hypothetical protein